MVSFELPIEHKEITALSYEHHGLIYPGCPHCKSTRVHKRKGFHLVAKWRCRKCHRTFRSPIRIITKVWRK